MGCGVGRYYPEEQFRWKSGHRLSGIRSGYSHSPPDVPPSSLLLTASRIPGGPLAEGVKGEGVAGGGGFGYQYAGAGLGMVFMPNQAWFNNQ